MKNNDKDLILVGGGGHCKAVIDVAISAGRNIKGIIDNNKQGETILGIPVIGGDDDIPSLATDNVEFLITVGQIKSGLIRLKIAHTISSVGGKFAAPVIAKTAHIAKGAVIGNGTVIMHNSVINSDAVVGKNCIINTGAIVEHDCRIGDFVHLSTGAIVNGTSTIGSNTFVGSHATIANNITITDNNIIGAGAVVINDINESGTYCGIPAKPLIKNK